jgi:hypothetical protein
MTAAATFMRRNPHCFDAQLVIEGPADDFEHGLLGRFDGGLIAARDVNAVRKRAPSYGVLPRHVSDVTFLNHMM